MFDSAGGFEEKFKRCEDREFGLRVQNLKITILYNHDVFFKKDLNELNLYSFFKKSFHEWKYSFILLQSSVEKFKFKDTQVIFTRIKTTNFLIVRILLILELFTIFFAYINFILIKLCRYHRDSIKKETNILLSKGLVIYRNSNSEIQTLFVKDDLSDFDLLNRKFLFKYIFIKKGM